MLHINNRFKPEIQSHSIEIQIYTKFKKWIGNNLKNRLICMYRVYNLDC